MPANDRPYQSPPAPRRRAGKHRPPHSRHPRTRAASTAYNELIVGSGNLIGTFNGTDYRGLKAASVVVSEVPTQAPAAIDVAVADNLTAATLSGGLVWLAANTSAGKDLDASAPEGTRVLSFSSVQLPVAGGGTAKVYLLGTV